MSRATLLFAPLLLWIASATAALPPLLDDSAMLDQSFIPALMLSNGKDAAKARAAHDAYEKAWTAFAAKYRGAKPGDAAWVGVFTGIDASNGRAGAALGAGKFPAAHQAQEEVRLALWKWREGQKLAYLPDLLTAFHETMEEIVIGSARIDPAMASREDIAKLKAHLATARGEWQAVLQAKWEPADYRLDAKRLADYRAAVADETKALDDFAAALESGEGARIAKAGAAIKPPFARAYRAFGVFPQ